MGLFEAEPKNASRGFKNLRAAEEGTTGHEIKTEVDRHWPQYEPYADTDFAASFAQDEDGAFWEMYLSLVLLEARKKLRKREELPKAERNTGPDICIQKGGRKIWIELITPDRGDEEEGKKNPDRVAELADGEADPEETRRQIEARIRGALKKKEEAFEQYRKDGLIGEKDSCIVAVCGAHFPLEAAGEYLPHAVSAVYPFGKELPANVDLKTGRMTTNFALSEEIELKKLNKNDEKKEPVPRAAFLGDEHKNISGIIWSTRGLGNFMGQPHDLTYVHNHGAVRPIPQGWFPWANEFIPDKEGKTLKRRQNRERKRAAKRVRAAFKAAARRAARRR